MTSPGCALDERVDVFCEVVDRLLLGFDCFDTLRLAFVQHAHDVFGRVLDNGEHRAVADWGVWS